MKNKILVVTAIAALLTLGSAAILAASVNSNDVTANTGADVDATGTVNTNTANTNSTSGAGSGTVNTNTANTNSTSGVTTGTASSTMTGRAATQAPALMNRDQFSSFTTSRWDANGDGIISSTEWNTATPSWFGSNSDISAFSAWDTNSDGYLNDVELGSFYADSGLYQAYDLNRDGIIDNTEAAQLPPR